jgi:hypothetical protein
MVIEGVGDDMCWIYVVGRKIDIRSIVIGVRKTVTYRMRC